MTDRCTTPTGVKLLAINGNIIVQVHPKQERTRSGIIIPDDGHVDKYATGTVRAIGKIPTVVKNDEGEVVELGLIPIPGVAIGDCVLFVTFLQDQHTNIQLRELLGDDYIRVKPSDVILVFDKDDLPRVQY